MMTPNPAHPANVRHALPDRRDVLPVLGIACPLVLLLGALAWTLAQGIFSGLSFATGVVAGLLLVMDPHAGGLVIGYLLAHDSDEPGGPQVERTLRLAPTLVVAGLGIGLVSWVGGLAAAGLSLLTAALIIASWTFVVLAGTAMVNREVRSPLVTIGAGGRGCALVVYHSARGGLMRQLQEALAAGMQAHGWQVDLSTASCHSPVDLFAYDALVLGSPSYYDGLARPIRDYLDRLGDLEGLPVTLVVSGFGSTGHAMRALRDAVEQANGTVVDEIEIWTKRSNRARDGTTDPREIMRRAGARLTGATRAAAA